MSRKIDALVAEKVMGWSSCKKASNADRWFGIDTDECVMHLPHYSTDIAAAFEVMERFCYPRVEFLQYPELWRCSLTESAELSMTLGTIEKHGVVVEESETAPMAICLAALKAVGVEVDAD